MKHLMIPVFALVALIAAAAAMVWHPSTKLSAGTTAMPSMQELHTAAGVNHVRVGRRYGNGADRRVRLIVEDRAK